MHINGPDKNYLIRPRIKPR